MVKKVTIKHGSNKYKNVKINSNESLSDFQAMLFSLTQVPPQRQKLIVKGQKILSDEDLKKIKNKSVIFLSGTAEEVSTNKDLNNSKYQFVEDMTTQQKQEHLSILPPGLKNLGNTCYLNSVLQCVKNIDGLKNILRNNLVQKPSLSNEIKNLLIQMDNSTDEVTPYDFVGFFRQAYPEFATTDDQGNYQQQDSDECFMKLMQTLSNELKFTKEEQQNLKSKYNNYIDYNFRGEMVVSTKCEEIENDTPQITHETFNKLRCFIETQTRSILDGIQLSLNEKITKFSDKLQRNAIYKKELKIKSLPPFLCVQLVRFFWKQKEQKNAKIVRSVVFPFTLDIREFCEDKLQKEITLYRRLKIKKEDKEREERSKSNNINSNKDLMDVDKKNNKNKNNNNNNNNNNDDNETKDDDGDIDMNDIDTKVLTTGYYELIGIVSHQGLRATSGHYIGYAKDPKRGWLKYDDDVVTNVKEEDIKKLYGGGQWQSGYMCFYKKIKSQL